VSPLIERLTEAVDLAGPVETALWKIFATAVPLERQPDTSASPVERAGEEHRGGMKVLENQAACPFRAFAVHRLGAREIDAPELGISPRERGTVAHQALELVWRELQSQRELLARSRDEISRLVETCVRAALDGALSRRSKNNAMKRFRTLEEARLKKLVLDWLDQERGRPPFEVVESEASRSVDVAGLTLRLKVDRVDCYADGGHAILDYKTSKLLSTADWEGERPDAPQLPLYASECGYDVSAVYFAKLVPGDMKLLGLEGSQLQERLPEWKRVVEKLATDYLAGCADVDPKDGAKTCERCDLQALCRINERGGRNVEGDEAVE
jgi:ATP-dependent helicase/nuclease subunit B